MLSMTEQTVKCSSLWDQHLLFTNKPDCEGVKGIQPIAFKSCNQGLFSVWKRKLCQPGHFFCISLKTRLLGNHMFLLVDVYSPE